MDVTGHLLFCLQRLAGTAPRTYEKPFDALLAGKSAAELTASLWTELGKHWHHSTRLSQKRVAAHASFYSLFLILGSQI